MFLVSSYRHLVASFSCKKHIPIRKLTHAFARMREKCYSIWQLSLAVWACLSLAWWVHTYISNTFLIPRQNKKLKWICAPAKAWARSEVSDSKFRCQSTGCCREDIYKVLQRNIIVFGSLRTLLWIHCWWCGISRNLLWSHVHCYKVILMVL